MSVQRYDINQPSLVAEGYSETTPNSEDGQIVYYDDHVAEVAALEARCAGLERERDALKVENERLDKESDEYLQQRDDSESDIGRIAAAIGQDLSSAYGVPHLIDDIEELDASHDRLTKERDALQAKLAAAEESMTHCVEYWNRSETDGAMSDALHEIIGTLEAILAGHAPATPMLDQLEAPPQPITIQADAPLARCRECCWTGPGVEVVQDIVLYCPACGGSSLEDAPATKGEGDE